jgi:outer membrane protein OmpA-like peptidoglycan-associated protein
MPWKQRTDGIAGYGGARDPPRASQASWSRASARRCAPYCRGAVTGSGQWVPMRSDDAPARRYSRHGYRRIRRVRRLAPILRSGRYRSRHRLARRTSTTDRDVRLRPQVTGSMAAAPSRICLLDADTGEELECVDNPQDLNKHSFTLQPNRNYKVVATKNGYTTASESFRTKPSDKVITKKLILAPDIRLEVFTFENPTKALLPGTTVTLTDLTDGSVQKVVITNALGNDFVFNVKTDRKYKLDAVKDGYSTAIETIDTHGATGTIKKDMYLQKVQLQELLPISLYFDNDYPNPRSNQPTTSSKFVALVNDYLIRKGDYIKNYTAPLSGQAKQQATNDIESFFTNDVQNGRDKFVAFLVQLEQRLAMGEKIELEVRGFASPRSKSDYNKILSERRINSIKNEMKSFNVGGISQYINNGSLKLKDVSYGDQTAKASVIGDLKDERNSIYSLDAARERRVEILKVNYK